MEKRIVKISRRGERGFIVSIPGAFMKELSMNPGDYVAITVENDKLVVKKV